MQRSALCRSRRELSDEGLDAEIGFDTAEQEPLEPEIDSSEIPVQKKDYVPAYRYVSYRRTGTKFNLRY